MKYKKRKLLLFICLLCISWLALIVCSKKDMHTGEEGAGHTEGVSTQATEAEALQHSEENAVELDENTLKTIGLTATAASIADIDETIHTTGKITADKNKEVHITSLVPGRINALLADWGETVTAGQELVCIESIELGERRADCLKAKAEYELAKTVFERNDRLYKQEAVSEKQLRESETALKSAEIQYQYAYKMLLLTGVTEEQIQQQLSADSSVGETCGVRLYSPIQGVVTERSVSRGEQVGPDVWIYTILDLSSVWIDVDVYEKDLIYVKKGGLIRLTVPAYSQKTFTGTIMYIGAVVDESSRTVKVRSQVDNSGFLLKPGMFASAFIIIGAKKQVLSVPEQAVLNENNQEYIFVQEGNRFQKRLISTGIRSGGKAEILSGITAGELVVLNGNYQLKTRLLMKSADPHAGHVH
jgi:cobalt-zinc-cadmium efflux system membrane fusion protein